MADNIMNLIEPLSASLSHGDLIAAEQLAKISVAIFKARMDRGMTQKEFADFLGVSQSMVSKWESQDYNYSIGALAEICDKLEMDLNVEMKPRSCRSFENLIFKSNSQETTNRVRPR